MRRFTLLMIFAVFALFALTTGTAHAQLDVYTHPETTPTPADGTAERKEPPAGGGGGWTQAPPAAGGGHTITIPGKSTIYIACRNALVSTNKKWLTITLSGAGIWNLHLKEANGYKTSNTSQKVKTSTLRNSYGSKRILKFLFKPQPQWERIKLKNTNKNPATVTVNASSKCGKTYRDAVSYDFVTNATYHNAHGAVSVPNDIRDIYYFPVNTPLNFGGLPTFTDYLGNPWSYQYVFVDPDGNSRPLGGVRFYTAGPGLDTGQEFDARFQLDATGDIQFDMYSLDSISGHYQTKFLDIANYDPTHVDPTWGDGDVNRDGIVDATDLAIAMGNMGMTDAVLYDGDMNNDMIVDGDDINIINMNMGRVYM